MLKAAKKIDFLFIDEVGVSLDKNQAYFGVGGLFINDTITINRELHDVFTGAVSFFEQREETFEFKFKYITQRSFRFYKRIIEILSQYHGLNFKFILKGKEDKWVNTTFWEKYLEYLNLLIDLLSNKQFVIVADYLSKPKYIKADLFDIIKQKPQVANILQLESQGSLLVQAADILLGGIGYQKRIKADLKVNVFKQQVSNLIMKLLENKKMSGYRPSLCRS